MAYSDRLRAVHNNILTSLKAIGLFKDERIIHSAQDVEVDVVFPEGTPPRTVLNFCSNNYLGLSNHSEVLTAAYKGLSVRGYGMSSVRFICGSQDIHKELERKLSNFLATEDTILFSSCFDANLGVFEAILGEEDAIITDRLNHASIIDGVRLCKAARYIYEHGDMHSLEEVLRASRGATQRLIVTDGVFSMDGDIAKLPEICTLAEKYDSMVLVDDSHATGFIGINGRGTHEFCDVLNRIDLITTTFGKALGGASGGCVSGRHELIELCRQRARPYLFSNTLSPVIVSASNRVMDIITGSTTLRDKLEWNTAYWRKGLENAGLCIRAGITPIVPVMLFNAKLAQDFARDLMDEGVFAIGFFYPVVPMGSARIRTQISAAHDKKHLDIALTAFTNVGEKYGILGANEAEIISKYGH
jgi:glycine C-acetyltransferase